MKRSESNLEPRLRNLELRSAAQRNIIDSLLTNHQRLEKDNKDIEKRMLEIEKTLVRLTIPMRAATWTAALFATSIIALVWSLILGKAQIIFP